MTIISLSRFCDRLADSDCGQDGTAILTGENFSAWVSNSTLPTRRGSALVALSTLARDEGEAHADIRALAGRISSLSPWSGEAAPVHDGLIGALRGRPDAFGAWLVSCLASLRVRKPALVTALAEVGLNISTLCHDTLVADHLRGRPVSGHVPPWDSADKATGRPVHHWHGHWRESDSLLLCPRDFSLVTDPDGKGAAILPAGHRLVLIGVPLGIDRQESCSSISWLGERIRSLARGHFQLVCDEEIRGHEELVARDHGLVHVRYGETPDALVPALERLAGVTGRMSRAGGSAPMAALPSLPVPAPFPPVGIDSSREQLISTIRDNQDRVIVVGGRPATGKTTLVLSALADSRIRRLFPGQTVHVALHDCADALQVVHAIARETRLPLTESRGAMHRLPEQLGESRRLLVLDGLETSLSRDPAGTGTLLNYLRAGRNQTLLVPLDGTLPQYIPVAATLPVEELTVAESRLVCQTYARGHSWQPAGGAPQAEMHRLLARIGRFPAAMRRLGVAMALSGDPVRVVRAATEGLSQARRFFRGRDQAVICEYGLVSAIILLCQAQGLEPQLRRLLGTLFLLPSGATPELFRDTGMGDASGLVPLAHDAGLVVRRQERLFLSPAAFRVLSQQPMEPGRDDLSALATHLAGAGEACLADGKIRRGSELAFACLAPSLLRVLSLLSAGPGAGQMLDRLRESGLARALALFDPAFAGVIRSSGNRHGSADTLFEAGEISLDAGQVTGAIDAWQEALLAARLGSDRRREGRILARLGEVLAQEEKFPEATRHYQDALRLARMEQNWRLQAELHARLADLALTQGRFSLADKRLGHARICARKHGNRRLLAQMFAKSARIARNEASRRQFSDQAGALMGIPAPAGGGLAAGGQA